MLSLLLFNIAPEVLDSETRQEKIIHPRKKETVIIHKQNNYCYRKFQRMCTKLLELISDFSGITGDDRVSIKLYFISMY